MPYPRSTFCRLLCPQKSILGIAAESVKGAMSKTTRVGRKRSGRPKKDEADRLKNVVQVRLTDEQLEMIKELAAVEDRDISEWIRRAAVKAAETELAADGKKKDG